MRRRQRMDTHSSVWVGPSVAPGFTLTGKTMILRGLLCVTGLCRQIWWVSVWPTEVSCNRDPGGSQSDLLPLPVGSELKSSVSLKAFFCKSEFVFWQKKEGSQLFLWLYCTFRPGGGYWKQTRLRQRTGIFQTHSVNSVLLCFFFLEFELNQ